MFLDIIHRLVCFEKPVLFLLKHNVSETGFSPHPQVKPPQVKPKTQLSRFYLRTGAESSLRNVVF
jgi:hypothetical protein